MITFVGSASDQGGSPKRVQALMGHSTIQMTFDTYGHLFPSAADDQVAMANYRRAFSSRELRYGRDLADRCSGLSALSVAPLPQVYFPTILVTTQLAGASPEIIAASVTQPACCLRCLREVVHQPALREDLDEIERAVAHLIVREVMTGRTLLQ